MRGKNFLLAGELAKVAGVSSDTLRHYERKGVLPRPQRGANGYRLYHPDALERVRLVRCALSVGFTLDELANVFREREKGNAPCQAVHSLAIEKLAALDSLLLNLHKLREILGGVLEDWDKRLDQTPFGTRAGLLENLAVSSLDLSLAKASFATTKLKRKEKRKR